MKSLNCWKCGVPLHETENKISFRAVCDQCLAAIHCCKNCKHYSPGRANDCNIPGTDLIPDRIVNNFCEEFSILGFPPSIPSNNEKKKFDDLFK